MGQSDTTGPAGADPTSFDLLLGAVRRGDGSARDAICRRILPALRRWASRRLPSYARGLIDTDDLAQDALMRTLSRFETIDLDAQGLVAYLRAAVLNRIRDEIRSARHRPQDLPVVDPVDDAPSPLDQAIGKQATERYEHALEELPTRERSAVIMRIELGFGFREIALALEWSSANSARMAVTRAIGRMAQSMGDARQ